MIAKFPGLAATKLQILKIARAGVRHVAAEGGVVPAEVVGLSVKFIHVR